jgi:hypothetical protein
MSPEMVYITVSVEKVVDVVLEDMKDKASLTTWCQLKL